MHGLVFMIDVTQVLLKQVEVSGEVKDNSFSFSRDMGNIEKMQ